MDDVDADIPVEERKPLYHCANVGIVIVGKMQVLPGDVQRRAISGLTQGRGVRWTQWSVAGTGDSGSSGLFPLGIERLAAWPNLLTSPRTR